MTTTSFVSEFLVAAIVCSGAITSVQENATAGQRSIESAPHLHGGENAPSSVAILRGQHQVDFIDEFALDETTTLRLLYEVLFDPEDSPLFNRVGRMTIDPSSGRIFAVDDGDGIVRVLGESGEHLFDIGRLSGNGPGDLDEPVWPLITANHELAVLQDLPPRISYFDAEDGAFLRMSRVDLPSFRALYGFFALDSGHFVIGTVSLTPSLFGTAVHVVDPNSVDGVSVDRSFVATQDFTAEFYELLAGGFVTMDLDGGILYSQRSPYSIRKYDADGTEIWRMDDPETVPIATSFLRFLPNGRVNFDPYPFSVSLLPTGPNQYVHSIFLIREGWQDDGGSRFRSQLEFVTVEDQFVVERLRVDSTRRAYFTAADQKGRLYGFVGDGTLVRATVEVDENASSKSLGRVH